MKYKTDFKRWLPYLIIFAVFILSAIVYFWPAVQGKVVYAGDSINGTAATQEGIRYHQETGDYSFWTGSMFSGMPNYRLVDTADILWILSYTRFDGL